MSARQPDLVPPIEDWEPVPLLDDGTPDYANLVHASEKVDSASPWEDFCSKRRNFESINSTRN